jgi:hypothetical protein
MGLKTDGTATFKVYTDEQQARLNVDETGRATTVDAVVCRDPRPAWVKNDTEPPAGRKDMGTWEMGFYTAEQQTRLKVDLEGHPAPASEPVETMVEATEKEPLICGRVDLRPAWVKNKTEAPTGRKNMGSWEMAVYTEEQQNRLGVDEKGAPYRLVDGPLIKPSWMEAGIEAPEGEQSMGTWVKAVYTAEQQTRLGVDEDGRDSRGATEAAAAPGVAAEGAAVGAVVTVADGAVCKDPRPLWVKYKLERPAGRKDMGGWEMGFYTEEQQTRLNVDSEGKHQVQDAARAGADVPPPTVVPTEVAAMPKEPLLCGRAELRPAWVRNKTEAPTGLKDMGTWQMGVYTEEQQARLSVDENGKPKHAAD